MGIAELIMGLIGGIVNSGLSISNNTKNMNSQRNANYWNKMMWLISMMREDTAVQRRVNDLKMAGLSPTLAAGSAAQTMGPITVKPVHSELDISNGINSGLQMANNLAQLRYMNEQIEKTRADTARIGIQTDLSMKEFPFKLASMSSGTSLKNLMSQMKNIEIEYAKETGNRLGAGGFIGNAIMDLFKGTGFIKSHTDSNLDEYKKASTEVKGLGTEIKNLDYFKKGKFPWEYNN